MPTCCAPTTGANCRRGIKNGHVEDVYAYRRKQRFSVRYGADSRPDKAFTPPSGKVPPICLMALRLSGLLKMPRWGIFLFNPAVCQRDLFRGLNDQRAQLGHPVIGHA